MHIDRKYYMYTTEYDIIITCIQLHTHVIITTRVKLLSQMLHMYMYI